MLATNVAASIWVIRPRGFLMDNEATRRREPEAYLLVR